MCCPDGSHQRRPSLQRRPVVDIVVTVADDDVAGLAVSKLASVATANVGEAVVYTFRVTNTGTVILNIVSAGRPAGHGGAGPTSLAPGAVANGMVTYTVQAGDLPGPLVNTVTATALSAGGNPVQAQATSNGDLVDARSCLRQDRRHPRHTRRMHHEHSDLWCRSTPRWSTVSAWKTRARARFCCRA